ncbi:MAG: phage replisome organizer N-terminal domain-containing protein [Lachnospiraceae bacterium]|nr:phage replisome organizer N-terminal domain-containing protein [Lachnospiraceae bacterium]
MEKTKTDGNGRYYWLKLKRDFFKRHDVQLVESMPNGKDYILFYLKLLCESIDHEGRLRFSEKIPYNENMLATITHTNIDVVRAAIDIFTQLGMMDVMDDGTYFMSEVRALIGSETEWAEKKRRYRENVHKLSGTSSGQSTGQIEDMFRTMSQKSEDNVLNNSGQCPGHCQDNFRQEIEREKDIDIYKPSPYSPTTSIQSISAREEEESGNIVENVDNSAFRENSVKYAFGSQENVFLTLEECEKLQQQFPLDFAKKIEVLSAYLAAHPEKVYASHYATILLWDARDQAWQRKDGMEGMAKELGFRDDIDMSVGLYYAKQMMNPLPEGLDE